MLNKSTRRVSHTCLALVVAELFFQKWVRTRLPRCRALENVQCTFCTYFLLLCILQQNHQTKKGTKGPKGMPVRGTSSPSSRGVTGVAKSPSQCPCLLCGTAVSLPAVSSSPHKTSSHGVVIWTVSWHIGTVNPKHSYNLGMAQVTPFMSSDTAHSILPTHINSTNSAEAEWQFLHHQEQVLGCNNFLTLLKDQVAPSSKLRLPGLLSMDTVVYKTVFQKLCHHFKVKIIK